MYSIKKKGLKLAISLFLCALMIFTLLPVGSAWAQDGTFNGFNADVNDAGELLLNATNFPDANFLAALRVRDTDSNGALSVAEADAVQVLSVVAEEIGSFEGIKFFKNLRELYGDNNYLRTFDASQNPKLINLSLAYQHTGSDTVLSVQNGSNYEVDLSTIVGAANLGNIGSVTGTGVVGGSTVTCVFDAATGIVTFTGQPITITYVYNVTTQAPVNPIKHMDVTLNVMRSSVITITSGSDANGAITEWMLKGDANHDGSVTDADPVLINQYDLDPLKITDPLGVEAGDVNNDTFTDTADSTLILDLMGFRTVLPNSQFTFRVVDTPKAGYKVKEVTITTPNGVVTLSPTTLTSGNYKLVIATDGKATVTGQSLATNDIQFTHEVIMTQVRVGIYIANENGRYPSFSGDFYPYRNIAGYSQVVPGATATLTRTDIETILTWQYVNLDLSKWQIDTDNSLLSNSVTGVPADAFVDDTKLNMFTYNSAYAPTGSTFNTYVYLRIVLRSPLTAIDLDFDTDGNGSVVNWLLAGDADRDQNVDYDDVDLMAEQARTGVDITDFEGHLSTDVNSDARYDDADVTLVRNIITGKTALPNSFFKYRVIDRPSAGYKFKEVEITTPAGTVTLSPTTLTSGDYKLTINSNGDAMLIGPSLATNEVIFNHEALPDAITLTTGSDANGSITEWMLKGDASRDKVVSAADPVLINQYDLDPLKITDPLGVEAGDVNGDNYTDTADSTNIGDLLAGRTALPNSSYTFRVIDTPNAGYKLKEVKITTPNGVTTLSPTTLTSGNYKLVIATDGKATVTGQSLKTNDIQFTHEMIPAAVTLTYGSDANGSITEWMLKGDATRDGQIIGASDIKAIKDHVLNTAVLTDQLAIESADVDKDGRISAGDYSALQRVVNGDDVLPNENVTFRVIDTPNAGYKLKEVTITTPNGVVTLSPTTLTSGNYKLVIAADGKATVTGQSLKTNDIQFTHEMIPAAVTLTYGSDANGSITEWMLKGDADLDGKFDGADIEDVADAAAYSTSLTGLAFEAADYNGDNAITVADVNTLLNLLTGTNTLPNSGLTFRVVDTPSAGYKLNEVKITTPNGVVTLSPTTLTSGNYKLVIAVDGKATVTGQSLKTNDVRFTHETVSVAAEYTIVYDGAGNDGGIVPTDNKKYKIGDAVTVPTGVPTKTGYTFKCWKVNPEYQPGATFTFDIVHANNASPANVVTLTAQWTSNTPVTPPVTPTVNSPKTSDDARVELFTMLMLISLMGIAYGVVYCKKNKKDEIR